MYDLIIGIDPGTQGGVSFFHHDWMAVEKLPQTGNLLKELIESYRGRSSCIAYLEKIYLPNGKAGALTFASGWGRIKGVLEVLEIPYEEVRPQEWMKRLGCMSKGDKNVTKECAKELYGKYSFDDGGTLPITHWSSDALLIGTYGCLVEADCGTDGEGR